MTFYLNHVQDDDEADTVGCCTLKVDNVTCVPPNKLQVLIFIKLFVLFALYDNLILIQYVSDCSSTCSLTFLVKIL
jgi:hypothetical protein